MKICLDLLKYNAEQWCILNAANEVAVEAFLNEEIGFLDIITVIKKTLNKNIVSNFHSIDDVIKWDQEARIISKNIINKIKN